MYYGIYHGIDNGNIVSGIVTQDWDRCAELTQGISGPSESNGVCQRKYDRKDKARTFAKTGVDPDSENGRAREQANEPNGNDELPPAENGAVNGVAALHVLHKARQTVWYAKQDDEVITVGVDDSIIHDTAAAVKGKCMKLRLMGYRTRVERRVEGWRKIPDNWGLVRGGNTTNDDRIWDKEEQMWLPISGGQVGERVDNFCGVLRRNLTEEEKRNFGSSTRNSRPGSVHQGIGRIEDQQERRYEEHM